MKEIFLEEISIKVPLSLSFVSEKDSSQLARFSDVVNVTDSVSIPSLSQEKLELDQKEIYVEIKHTTGCKWLNPM